MMCIVLQVILADFVVNGMAHGGILSLHHPDMSVHGPSHTIGSSITPKRTIGVTIEVTIRDIKDQRHRAPANATLLTIATNTKNHLFIAAPLYKSLNRGAAIM